MKIKKTLDKQGKINKTFEKFGFFLLTLLILGNLVIAFNFYFLKTINISNFFYLQAHKNEYFDPTKRY